MRVHATVKPFRVVPKTYRLPCFAIDPPEKDGGVVAAAIAHHLQAKDKVPILLRMQTDPNTIYYFEDLEEAAKDSRYDAMTQQYLAAFLGLEKAFLILEPQCC